MGNAAALLRPGATEMKPALVHLKMGAASMLFTGSMVAALDFYREPQTVWTALGCGISFCVALQAIAWFVRLQ